MFGEILEIKDNNVIVKNVLSKIESNYLNVHVVFEHENTKMIGKISNISSEYFTISLIGEILNNKLVTGILKFPNMNSKVRIIYTSEIAYILGHQNVESVDNLYLGKSLSYPNFNVTVKNDTFFGSHFAVLGNTGSGKSCGVARLIQNIFYNKEKKPTNARIVMFDVYGEYYSAFKKIEEIPGIKVKNLVTNLKGANDQIISIPPHLLEIDDLALLLNAEDSSQLPIIEKALNLVYIFSEQEEIVLKHKDYILARALLDILASGKNPTQIRDQVVAVLSSFNTSDISLDSKIEQPGYIRTLKQCLNIDATGKINTMELVIEYLEQFVTEEIEMPKFKTTHTYTLKDLYNAFEFALISEGVLKSDKIFDKANILKVRLDAIIKSEASMYFQNSEFVTKEQFVENLFKVNSIEQAQILNINFDAIEERLAKTLTKIYSKFFWNYATNLTPRASAPIQIIVEEAHRYVQNDNDVEVLGYNIFDRITKEGRKYGVLLGLVTQRPSELSVTALSQCSNFLVFRMYHPEDLNIVARISTNIKEEDLQKLKTLRPGIALGFGTAFALTEYINFEYPNPAPASTNANINEIWYK